MSGQQAWLPPAPQSCRTVPMLATHIECPNIPQLPLPSQKWSRRGAAPRCLLQRRAQPRTLSSTGVHMRILMGRPKSITISPHQYAKSSCHFLFLSQL